MPLTLLGWLQQEFATIPQLTPWLFGLALLISASGFYRTVYFVSIGYAFSIAAMAVTTLLVFRQELTWFNLAAKRLPGGVRPASGHLSAPAGS